ncbi:MAG: D-alanyl-D-alanine dipeptidase [candidate division TM6 bacterium GW2011_GWF2_30_66]|nr:MAG: D-alanyl-D-alanine dipeptidase [candidate division TM6 bacterium GW2011_GWF2_30_66]
MIFLKHKSFMVFFLIIFVSFGSCFALSQYARSKGFVELSEIDPTIMTSLRYITNENFLGTPVDGYKKDCVVLIEQVAQALKKVQQEVKKDGYCLVVYDAYRPQMAVDHFVRWSKDVENQKKKNQYYPRVNKADAFELGYIARRSGHSRGATVDVTIIKDGQKLHRIIEKKRKLLDGFEIKFLDDGTVDMGSSFDLFDIASHFENSLIEEEYKKNRIYLRNVMEKFGFEPYSKEWWHFTFKPEPYPAGIDSSYFNFAIE